MQERSSKSLSASRRGLLTGSVVTVVLGGADSRARPVHCFESWEAERTELERLLDVTLEANEKLRNRMLDRSESLERLIFETDSLELAAIRVKARLLLWLMEMERADGVVAMRHIQAYLELQEPTASASPRNS